MVARLLPDTLRTSTLQIIPVELERVCDETDEQIQFHFSCELSPGDVILQDPQPAVDGRGHRHGQECFVVAVAIAGVT